ncbi:MAG: hypothetical protein QM775_28355 [Pirellulales bacterium]
MKITWILGAGSSKEAGYPLVSEFLSPKYLNWAQKAWWLNGLEGGPLHTLSQEQQHFSSASQNLNELMATFLKAGDLPQMDRLNNYILRLLQYILDFQSQYCLIPYATSLAAYIAASHSSVISFNYDMLLEEQLGLFHSTAEEVYGQQLLGHEPPYNLGLEPSETYFGRFSGLSYCVAPSGSGYVINMPISGGSVRIHKVHGSIAWAYCGTCQGIMYAPPLTDDMSFTQNLIPTSTMVFRRKCRRCQSEQPFHMLLVPPACDQSFSSMGKIGYDLDKRGSRPTVS